jgi:hypothetical protein
MHSTITTAIVVLTVTVVLAFVYMCAVAFGFAFSFAARQCSCMLGFLGCQKGWEKRRQNYLRQEQNAFLF